MLNIYTHRVTLVQSKSTGVGIDATRHSAIVHKGAVGQHEVAEVAAGLPQRAAAGEQHHEGVADDRYQQREESALGNSRRWIL